MAGRSTNQRLPRASSPATSPSSTRFRQQHQGHYLQEENPNLAASAQPPALSKPVTPLTRSRPRSRQKDRLEAAEYNNDNDLWEQSQQYLTDSQGGGKSCRQYSAYTTCAENKISRFPGPGSYNVANLKPGGPSFSMGSRSSLRKEWAERTYSPGPGTYDVSTKNSGPSFSIAPRVRPPASQQDMNPGPGTYSDLSNTFGRGLSFSIRERFK